MCEGNDSYSKAVGIVGIDSAVGDSQSTVPALVTADAGATDSEAALSEAKPATQVELIPSEEDEDEITLRIRVQRRDVQQRAALERILANQSQLHEGLEGAQKEISRLGKSQFKANTLMESTQENLTRLLNQLTEALQTRDRQVEQLLQGRDGERKEAKLNLIKELLPVLDAMEEAMKMAEPLLHPQRLALPSAKSEMSWWEKLRQRLRLPVRTLSKREEPAHTSNFSAWWDGLRLVHSRLLGVLKREGVEPVESVGQPFDPRIHVAVETVSDDRLADNIIVSEQLRGYMCGERAVRFAEVVVNRKVKVKLEENAEFENPKRGEFNAVQ